MAGDWIKMRGNLWDDPRVGRIVDMTETSEAAVIGGLYWLWATADQHTEDGCLPGLSMRQIDRKTGIPGFAAALVEINWLRDDPQGVVIVSFEEHNGTSAKKRCQTAKRVANHASANAELTQPEQETNADSVSSALAREEKRREETKEEPTVLVGKPAASRPPDCPTQDLIDLYHEHLPMLPRVEVVNDSRKRALSARWREVVTDPQIRGSPDSKAKALDWFAWFFSHAATSKFLTGKAKDWRADFDFLMTPTKFAKTAEGSYHKDSA